MGLELTPQGVMVGLGSLAAVVLAIVNRSSLGWLLRRGKQRIADAATPSHDDTHPEADVMDVLKWLSQLNGSKRLGLEGPLAEMFDRLLNGEVIADPQDVCTFVLLRDLTRSTHEMGLDCSDELTAIYSKLIHHLRPKDVTPNE